MTPSERPCPRCAALVAAGARFCPSCGFAVSRLSPGQVLDGKYEILDKIGEGGMGEVYRARHLHLDEIRIIKVTKPAAMGEAAEPRRFQEEARIATLVRHPNVAALYDFSRQPDGSFYMVWEFIDGVTLEAWLSRRGPLPPARALEIAQQILAGLGEIHAQGIVHRDLSPDNIMLREAASGGLQAKIIDLGIAKRVAAESLQMTGTGLFLGKLKYCSPEQAGALPPGSAVDARSDLYSFGIVLYEMLTGKAPFESATPEGYIGKHLHTAPPPLDVSRLPRGLGPALASAVARSLEKRRERRFRDAKEFADALGRLMPAAIAATEDAPTETIRRRRTPARARGIAALLLIAAAAGGFYVLRRRGVARESAAPAPAASPAARPSPTEAASVDALVAAAPGLLKQSLKEAGMAPTPPHPHPPVPIEAGVPAIGAAVPQFPAAPDSGPRPPAPAQVRRFIELWKLRPNELRARHAQEVAKMADRFVEVYPDDRLADEIEKTLPAFLKAQATAALDDAQPLVALLYFRAYTQLSFAPEDPELERRIEKIRPPGKTPGPRRRRPEPGTPNR